MYLMPKITPLRVFFLCWISFFVLFWSKALFIDSTGNLVAGHPIMWADWAAHLTMTTAIAERGVGISSPLVIGEPFRYPFMINALSAILLRLGVDLIPAMVIPSFLSSIFLLFSLVWWFRTLLRSDSKAMLATTFFFFSGGLGFVFALKDISAVWQQAELPWHTFLAQTSQSYTYYEKFGVVAINVVHGMIIPQRAFSLGVAVALVGLTLVLKWWRNSAQTDGLQRQWNLVAAGIVFGLLPLIHTHSFLAVFCILSCWAVISLVQKQRHKVVGWFLIAGITTTIALPQLIYLQAIPGFLKTGTTASGITLKLGWMAQDFSMNWIVFSLLNWGVVLPLAAFSFSLLGMKGTLEQKKLALEFIPFWVLFLAANLVSFQPSIWDNSKLLIWAYLGFCGLAATSITHLINLQAHTKSHILKVKVAFVIGILLSLLAVATGSLDLYRVLRHDLHKQQLSSQHDVQLAQWVQKNTSKDSIWLTGNYHTHWLFTLTGRQAVLTYPGWVWTHGYSYIEQERVSRGIYESPIVDKNNLQKYGITHIVIGPYERHQFRVNPIWDTNNPATFIELLYETKNTKIFVVKSD